MGSTNIPWGTNSACDLTELGNNTRTLLFSPHHAVQQANYTVQHPSVSPSLSLPGTPLDIPPLLALRRLRPLLSILGVIDHTCRFLARFFLGLLHRLLPVVLGQPQLDAFCRACGACNHMLILQFCILIQTCYQSPLHVCLSIYIHQGRASHHYIKMQDTNIMASCFKLKFDLQLVL